MERQRIAIVSSLAALVFFFCIPCHVLRIEAVREHRTVFVRIIRPNDTFATTYIHSVELSPVREYFRIDADFRIVLYETRFSSCNTGLPTSLAEEEILDIEGDHLRISHMNRVVPVIDLWVDARYDNTLQMGEETGISLPPLAGDTLLRVTVESIPLFTFVCLKTGLYL